MKYEVTGYDYGVVVTSHIVHSGRMVKVECVFEHEADGLRVSNLKLVSVGGRRLGKKLSKTTSTINYINMVTDKIDLTDIGVIYWKNRLSLVVDEQTEEFQMETLIKLLQDKVRNNIDYSSEVHELEWLLSLGSDEIKLPVADLDKVNPVGKIKVVTQNPGEKSFEYQPIRELPLIEREALKKHHIVGPNGIDYGELTKYVKGYLTNLLLKYPSDKDWVCVEVTITTAHHVISVSSSTTHEDFSANKEIIDRGYIFEGLRGESNVELLTSFPNHLGEVTNVLVTKRNPYAEKLTG